MTIHIVGIGGIGASAIAQYYKTRGYTVSGSDKAKSEIVELLRSKGIAVRVGKHTTSNLPLKTDLVVYSPAVQRDNPELKEARKRGITTQSYPEALGDLTTLYETIAVSGTHGKSTTTAMTALVLIAAGLDPTVIVGTKLKEFGGSNFRAGKGKYLIIEADEHMASFLQYRPRVIVLTTLEEDHLDFYKSLQNLKKTFRQYIQNLPPDGLLIVNEADKNIVSLVPKNPKFKVVWYGKDKRVKLKVPGNHNLANATAALSVAQALRVPDKASLKTLSRFQGTWRRFEILKLPRYTLVSDYGHHPTEIEATMQAVQEKWPSKKVWLIFQPHQHDRTHRLLSRFRATLSSLSAERILIAPIYEVAGRETSGVKARVSSEKLASGTRAESMTLENIRRELRNVPRGAVVVLMGAGDIYEKLTRKLTS